VSPAFHAQEVIEVQVQEYQPPAAPRTEDAAPPTATPPTATPPAATPPAPPRPAGEPRSRLGGAVVSLAAIAIGVVGMVDLAGPAVPGAAYLAAPLTVVGLGLVVGAFVGRARWLIAVGAVLSLALGAAATAERLGTLDGSVTWRPTSVDQLEATYTIEVGSAVLDLSALDFAGRVDTVEVTVGVGDLTVLVPPNVDVRAEATVDVGNADVFGTRWSGIGQSTHTVTDNGLDGPGGGELTLRAVVDIGDVEVHR
jgi:hypothetical protein